jgi:sec-independent protein translocase protein TatC
MMYFLFLNMIFCFQIPIIINLLIYLKKVELDFIIKNRKICYFILFNFSALISPPEILNQIFIYLLLLFLFEIVILYNYFNYYLNN